MWNLLRRLSCDCNCPWLVAGDFNEIMYSFEKSGGLPRDSKRMEVFRDTLKSGVANVEWLTLFPTGIVQHLPYSSSDHYPLLANTDSNRSYSGDQRFHFEAWWTLEDSFEGALKDIWESSSELLVDKLKTVLIGLKKWAKELKCNKGEQKRRLTK
ncbi:putative Transposon TX1 [Gossypium australe]|uniref:Putative Transposon TX1 n=1 Tax=Gossypium australe TaxID=47621 RepID=A0A5B6VHR5_9ROSI|nr:putative Transposon TX1 [Gossypium australe]